MTVEKCKTILIVECNKPSFDGFIVDSNDGEQEWLSDVSTTDSIASHHCGATCRFGMMDKYLQQVNKLM